MTSSHRGASIDDQHSGATRHTALTGTGEADRTGDDADTVREVHDRGTLDRLPLPGWLRRRWPLTVARAALNIGLFLVLFQLYKVVRRQFIQQSNDEAYGNADQIIRWEKTLHVFVERDLQRFAIDHEWIIRGLNWYYAGFMWIFYGCCVVAIVLAPARYRPLRRVFLCSMALALPWYAIYPLAPPRFMTAEGFVDTLMIFGPNYFSNEGLVTANQFAAMPSMHIGWSTIGAVMLAVAIPRWRKIPLGPLLGLLHISMMTLTVMATGNHFVLDAVGGWLVVLAAFALARALPGWRSPLRAPRGFIPSPGAPRPASGASPSVGGASSRAGTA